MRGAVKRRKRSDKREAVKGKIKLSVHFDIQGRPYSIGTHIMRR